MKTDEKQKEEAPKASTAPSNIPQVEELPDIAPVSASEEPAITEYKGRYKNSVDGRVYALAVKEDAPNQRTHFLRNSIGLDNCTKEEFKQRYEKE